MDCQGRILNSIALLVLTTLLSVSVVMFCQGANAQSQAAHNIANKDLSELAWLKSTSDRVTALTSEPISCLDPSKDGQHGEWIRKGELVFKSPALLGGQAAKANISCASCHRNGRGNQDFFFAGISDKPGTADVTSGVFGKQRADNIFNPVMIPDLASSEGQNKVNRKDRDALLVFVHGQIEEEFSGAKPPESIMYSLITYLQAISTTDCDLSAKKPINWQEDWVAARDAAVFSVEARDSDDMASARFYARTARASLQRLDSRFTDVDIHAGLIALSRTIERSVNQVGTLNAWPHNAKALEVLLAESASQSLYMPDVLQAWLDG